MPRHVDPDSRRTAIAEAVWRILCEHGIEAATVRKVASEAGLSMGSLRHYFGSQSELHLFAMRLVLERATARVNAVEQVADPWQHAERVLTALLPLDAERITEVEVWLAFVSRAQVDPALRALNAETFAALHAASARVVTELIASGTTRPGLDPDVESVRLSALLDGLVVQAVNQPEQRPSHLIISVLRAHLADLRVSENRGTATAHGCPGSATGRPAR